MREAMFGLILVGAVGAAVWFIPFGGASEPGYAMSIGEAKLLLAKADLRPGKEPFGRLDMMVTAPTRDVVSFAGSGTFAQIDCRVELTPVGSDHVTAKTGCLRKAPLDGAAASAARDITEIGFAEFVDAALDRREFDEAKLRRVTTAAVLRNMPKMQRDALEMQRQVSGMVRESNAQDQHRNSAGPAADWGEPVPPSDFAADGVEGL